MKNSSLATLSVIIITKNEAHDIRDCLESVKWADEIIILDSGSTDDTIKIAKEYTQSIYTSDSWPGFGAQKNRVLSYATKDWVLSIDADERVDADLKAEIQATLQHPQHDVYLMPRLSSFCGKFIHHSGWRPDYIARLFKRGSAKFSDHLVHESLLFDANPGRLNHSLLHLSYKNLDEVLDKMHRYAKLGAEDMHKRKKQTSLFSTVLHSFWAFVRTYFIRLGFLDGSHGFILAVNNAQTTYYKYLRLYFLNKNVNE